MECTREGVVSAKGKPYHRGIQPTGPAADDRGFHDGSDYENDECHAGFLVEIGESTWKEEEEEDLSRVWVVDEKKSSLRPDSNRRPKDDSATSTVPHSTTELPEDSSPCLTVFHSAHHVFFTVNTR